MQKQLLGLVIFIGIFSLLLGFSLSQASEPAPKIHLLYASFDPLAEGEPDVSSHLRASPDSPYHLLQFTGPPQAAWVSDLQARGVVFYSYVPAFAYVVRVPAGSQTAVASHPAVRWLGPLHPAYKISPLIEGGLFLVELFPGADNTAVAASLIALGATIQQQDEAAHWLVVGAEATLVPALAAIEEVRWIQSLTPMQELNDDARWLSHDALLDRPTLHERGLTGADQVGAVADQGLAVYDYGTADPLLYNAVPSCYFVDDGDGAPRLPGPDHRKIVNYVVPPGSGGDFIDATGHGTHVVGSVAGDQAPWDEVSAADGQAYAGRIFFQDIGRGVAFPEDPIAEIVPPADFRVLFGQAYDPDADGRYQPDLEPRTHSNSWGSPQPIYSAESGQTDDFMWTHPDFLIFFAAGNQGPSPGTVGYPATAKNVVTVGATENGYADAHNLMFSSSHGPAPVGRLKPTVVGPGARITSALRGHPCGTTDKDGTSMATPTLHGITLLLRQYLWDGYYPDGAPETARRLHPSAALLKAMLINSGRPVSGDYSDNANGGSWPSHGQGWGRVTAEDVLYFPGDSRVLWLRDEYALDGSVGLGAAGETRAFTLEVGNGRPFAVEPLKIVLAWTDYPGDPIAGGALVNDLNLTVTGPDGTLNMGNDVASNDFLGTPDLPLAMPDNVNPWEVVYLADPTPGVYTITVEAAGLGSLALDSVRRQGFALVVTGDLRGHAPRAQFEYPVYEALPTAVARLRLTDNSQSDSVTAVVASDTDPAGVPVTLTETAPGSGVFVGEVVLTTETAVAGQLAVSQDDKVQLRYGEALAVAEIGRLPLNLIHPPVLDTPENADGDGRYTLTWTPPAETTNLAGNIVQEATNYTVSLGDDAEGTLANLWDSGGLQPWQQDLQHRQSGTFSYWSGRGDALVNLDTSLTLKEPVTIPADVVEATLTFYSRYYNDFNDFGHVEISANGEPWSPLRRLYANPRVPPTDAPLRLHQFDLSPYVGTPVRIRFRYNNGQFSQAPDSPGWWVDDISISGATWRTLAITAPEATSYEVAGRAIGRYFYRVRTLYQDGSTTAASNVAAVAVTKATPLAGGGRATGGGWLATPGGAKISFNFRVQQQDGHAQGHVQLRDKEVDVFIEARDITAVGAVVGECGGFTAAGNALEFHSTGTFNGNVAEFRVCLQDNGEPGNEKVTETPDLFYLACLSGCDYRTDRRSSDNGLDGGNIRVHESPSSGSDGSDESSTAVSVLLLDPMLSDDIAGTLQTLTVTAYDAAGQPCSGAEIRLQEDGVLTTLTALTGPEGTAVFNVTISPGSSEYIAVTENLDSNPAELNGVLAE